MDSRLASEVQNRCPDRGGWGLKEGHLPHPACFQRWREGNTRGVGSERWYEVKGWGSDEQSDPVVRFDPENGVP